MTWNTDLRRFILPKLEINRYGAIIEHFTRSEDFMRPSRRESFLMLIRWKWIRPAQGRESGSSKCLILSLWTSTANTVCGVSDINFSHICDPMNPPAPIMHIVIGFIVFPSRSSLAVDADISLTLFDRSLLFSVGFGLVSVTVSPVRFGGNWEGRRLLNGEIKS